MTPENNEIYLPALRAIMMDWTFYSTIMKLKDIRERIKLVEEIQDNPILNGLVQKRITAQANEISDYLLTHPQCFLNSLIVGVYGGDPEWIELKVSENKNLPEIPLSEEGILGYLKLSGRETLFILDGQQRVVGIRGALEKSSLDSNIYNDETSVILIGHNNTKEGLERIRRLISILNRYQILSIQ